MSLLGLPYLSVYAMSKGALGQLTKALAAEWGRYNIQVNCIAPGFIITDLNRKMWESRACGSGSKARRPIRGWALPNDIAPLAVFLARPGRRLHHRADHCGRWRLLDHGSLAIRAGGLTDAPPDPELLRCSSCCARSRLSSSPVPWIATCARRRPANARAAA